MIDKSEIEIFIMNALSEILPEDVPLAPGTVLLGRGSVMDSLGLVSLLAALEDFCLENGLPFKWASDVAMSEKRSHYRTVGTLAEYLYDLSRPSTMET